MKVRICFCAESLVWIAKHLQKSAIKRWKMMVADAPFQDPEGGMKPFKTFTAKQINRASNRKIIRNFRSFRDDPDLDLKAIENIRKELKTKRKKRRTAKQIRATKKLIAFNKRRRAKR